MSLCHLSDASDPWFRACRFRFRRGAVAAPALELCGEHQPDQSEIGELLAGSG